MDWTKLANAETTAAKEVNTFLKGLSEQGKFYGHDEAGKATKGIGHAIWEVPARILGAPIKALRNTGKNLLFGSKLKMGPMAGERLRAVAGRGAMSPSTKKAYEAWKRGEVKGEFVKVPSKWGQHHYFQKNFEQAGLVGSMKKHPLAYGAVGLGGALLALKPGLRPLATGMVPEVPENGVHPDVQRQFSQEVSGASPLTKSTWG